MRVFTKILAIILSIALLTMLVNCGGEEEKKVVKAKKVENKEWGKDLDPILAFNNVSWEDLATFWQKMKVFEAGEYSVGTNNTSYPDRNPQFKMQIEAFTIMDTPVTNNMFSVFVDDASGYTNKEFWSEEGWKWKESNNISEPEGWGNLDRSSDQSDDNLKPAVNVSWYEANALCIALTNTKKAGGKENYVRLPTEFEWEVAANDGTGSEYPWGNEYNREVLDQSEKGVKITGSTLGVETKKNIRDMIGNLHQWTSSEYKLYPGNSTGFTSPKLNKGYMVARGTSYQYADHGRTVHYRLPLPKETRDERVGIRLVHSNYNVLKGMWQQEEDKGF